METLGLVFWTFGTAGWVVKAFALFWPLAAHVFLLNETRKDKLAVRLWTSAFFLVLFYSWGGNAVWPSVMISALSIPIASSLSRGRMREAGLWLGFAILVKQTAAYLLILVIVRLVLQRKPREAGWVALTLPPTLVRFT